MKTELTGIFGKLPAHGDFLHRNLPSKVVNEWDAWLQTFIGSTQERLGESWLDIYLTSPIWRFCFSPGVVDDHFWAGIVLPSVDRVGRYFPFSVMRKLADSTVPCQFVVEQQKWFEAIEGVALKALDGQLSVDQLLDSAGQLVLAETTYAKQAQPRVNAGLVVDMDLESTTPLNTMPFILDAFVSGAFSSYGAWTTLGSEKVEPCMFICHSMPPVAGASAMLDGLWEHWEWSVPVRPLTAYSSSQASGDMSNLPVEGDLED